MYANCMPQIGWMKLHATDWMNDLHKNYFCQTCKPKSNKSHDFLPSFTDDQNSSNMWSATGQLHRG